MGKLKQVSVVGLGLLGGSVSLTVLRTFSNVKVVGYTHRLSTRRKARKLAVASEIADDLKQSVRDADIVILATPIQTFEKIFEQISNVLSKGCIVTDVGSTKVLPHRWAEKKLRKDVFYVGSHPIAGSEQRGVEFARDDLFEQADCIITRTEKTNAGAVAKLKDFWSHLGCRTEVMNPTEHDRIFANISHLPHLTAAALINFNDNLKFAGRGFLDTTRVASGPDNIWVDILTTNAANCEKAINGIIKELEKFEKALKANDTEKIEMLLRSARNKRAVLINHIIKNKGFIS